MMKCPICNEEVHRVISRQLRSGNGLVVFCETCQLGLLDGRVENKLSIYYGTDYWKTHGPNLGKKSDYHELFEAYVNYQHRRVEVLDDILTPETKLLEIGCATGHFLYNIKDRVEKVVGVDYDKEAASYAAERCGCLTFGGALANAGLQKHSFDVVCAFQTLEHVPNPVDFIEEAGSYLRAGGYLVIEVPSLTDPLLTLFDSAAYRTFFITKIICYTSPPIRC